METVEGIGNTNNARFARLCVCVCVFSKREELAVDLRARKP